MFWTIDGEEIAVFPRAGGAVEVIRWDAQRKEVYVSTDLTRAEAIWAIRNLLASGVPVKAEQSAQSINLFDRSWPVVHLQIDKQPYIKNNIIYCYSKSKEMSALRQGQLRALFLQQWIMQCVGFWEEHFNQLIPKITFRANKNTAFKVNKLGASISFDKGLVRFSRTCIDYAVFLAVTAYLELPIAERDKIATKKYPDKRMFDKVLAYEYTTGNSD